MYTELKVPVVCTASKLGDGWGAERRMRGGEMFPTLMVGWRASMVRGEEAGCFCEVPGMSIVAVCTCRKVTKVTTSAS